MRCSGCGNLWLAMTSTFLVGLTLIIMILVIAFSWHFEIKVNRMMALAIIFLLLLSILAFLFALYATLSQSRRSRSLLIVFLVLLVVGLVAFGACVIALRKGIVKMFRDWWSGTKTRENEVRRFELALQCCGWIGNETRCEVAVYSWGWPGCKTTIADFFAKYDRWIGGCLLGLAILDLIPLVIALRLCNSREQDLAI